MLHIVRSTRISREIKDVNEIRDYQDISAAACPEIPSHPHGSRDYRFLKVETIDIVKQSRNVAFVGLIRRKIWQYTTTLSKGDLAGFIHLENFVAHRFSGRYPNP